MSNERATRARKYLNPIRINVIGEVFVTVEWDGGHLSLTGVEGPLRNGNSRGSCGQIDMSLREDTREDWVYKPGWDGEMVTRLLEVWDRWHLNGLKAGTPKQEAFIREWKKTHRYDYVAACNALEEVDLLVDYDHFPPDEDGEKRGYKYGTAWLFEEVPEEVVDWLFQLPAATVSMPSVWMR